MPLPPDPTVIELLLAHVPLDTVTVPTLSADLLIVASVLLTLPPFTFSVPVPVPPTVRLVLLAHVPLDTVAVPTPPALLPRVPAVLLT